MIASCCKMWRVIKTSCIVSYTEFFFTNETFLFVWNQLILRAECLILNNQPATISENDAGWFWKSAKDAIVRWGALRKDAKQGQINRMQALELQIRVMYASYYTGAWGTWYDAHRWVMSHCFLRIGEHSFSIMALHNQFCAITQLILCYYTTNLVLNTRRALLNLENVVTCNKYTRIRRTLKK